MKRRSQFPMIEQQVRDSGDGKVDDLGRRPPPDSGNDPEDSNVERRRAPDDPERHQQQGEPRHYGYSAKPQLSGRVVDHHVRPDPQDGTGGKGKHLHARRNHSQSDAPSQHRRNSRQHHRNGVETDSPGPGDEAPQCHHIRLNTAIGLAPEESEHLAVTDLGSHQTDDRPVAGQWAVP